MSLDVSMFSFLHAVTLRRIRHSSYREIQAALHAEKVDLSFNQDGPSKSRAQTVCDCRIYRPVPVRHENKLCESARVAFFGAGFDFLLPVKARRSDHVNAQTAKHNV